MLRHLADVFVSWGPLGLFLLATFDSVGVPLPATVDALLVFLSATRPDQAPLLALLAVAGSFTGNLILFGIARRGGQLYLDRHTHTGRGAKLRQWFARYGLLTVFVPCLVPIPMPLKVFVICAGALGIRWWVFAGVVLAARIPRYCALAYLGSHLGPGAYQYVKTHTWHLVGFALALAILLSVAPRIAANRKPASYS